MSIVKRASLSAACIMAASTAFASGPLPTPSEPIVFAPPAAPPIPVVYDWSGLFVGANIGGTSAHVRVRDPDYNGENFRYSTGANVSFGVQAGFNVQTGNLVFGVMGELGRLGASGSQQLPSFVGDPTRIDDSVAAVRIGNYGTLTGRAGFASDRILGYVRGGLAMAQVRVSYTDPNPNGLTLDSGTSVSELRTGWTLGAGVEYAVASNVSLSGEYMYMNLGRLTHTAIDSGAGSNTFTHAVSTHSLRLGVNFHF